MDLANIIKNIRQNTGIIRYRYDLKSLENGFNYFCLIANAMLESKRIKFDSTLVQSGIETLVNWVYMLRQDLDFTKGILFKGHTGRGKTFLFKVFVEFVRIDNIKFIQNGKPVLLAPKIINSRQISGEYQDPVNGGYKVIEKYSQMVSLVIDDIGAEQSESNNYGNKINVIEEIITKREEMNMLTFGTTNFNSMKEESQYDDRTISRMNALFNGVALNHEKDYRKL